VGTTSPLPGALHGRSIGSLGQRLENKVQTPSCSVRIKFPMVIQAYRACAVALVRAVSKVSKEI